MKNPIEIVGARQNNLKDVNVKIPRESLTVITGLSGSGKSSLAFDTLFAEGQRRFLESLSTYARSRLPLIKKPDVSMILGLSPVVSIQQKKGISNPRSTIGSLTDIDSYLRLFFSVAGVAYCPYCNKKVSIESSNKMAERIQSLPKGTNVEIRAPVSRIYAESYRYLFDEIRNKGYRKFRVNGNLYDSSVEPELDKNVDYQIEVIIDKFEIKDDIYKQLLDSVEQGLLIGQRFLRIEILNPEALDNNLDSFYDAFACSDHHTVTGELLPWYFTSNDLESACDTCEGLGTHMVAEPFLMIENENKSLREGALNKFVINLDTKTYKRHPNMTYIRVYSLSKYYGFSLDKPFKDLPQKIKDILFYGTKGEEFVLQQPEDHRIEDFKSLDPRRFGAFGKKITYEGIAHRIQRWYKQYYSKRRTPNSVDERHAQKVMIEKTCPDCNGKKLKYLRF
ncbi:MAG: excinuclease ABC subunit UvrA, partial [Candidatus Kariarchaeaceae archaeon]